jgi:probable HAF family extracellular repeat protein
MRLAVLLIALWSTFLGNHLTAATTYSVQDLGDGFIPLAINNLGQIAGAGTTSERATAFLLDDGALTPILHPGGEEVRVRAINNLGQVVGASRDTIGYDHAFVWNKDSGWRGLDPPDVDYGWANSINDAGVIVGELFGEAALWQTDGQIIRLGHLGGQYSDAFGVNSAGDVVGLSALDLVGLQQHAFLWRQGEMHDLGVTDSITKGFQEYAIGFNINNRGQIAGDAVGYNKNNSPDVPNYGFLWNQSTGLKALVPNVSFFALNDAGQAVGGISENGLFTWNAMLYENGTVYNLNDLIASPRSVRLMEATGINNAGQIIAWGRAALSDPNEHGYLLTPIPEPSSLILCLICAGWMSQMVRGWHRLSAGCAMPSRIAWTAECRCGVAVRGKVR